jgi:hypothetical protein
MHIEYRQQMLARYTCQLDRHTRTLHGVSEPNLYRSLYTGPQIEMIELDDEQWLKVTHRPPYAPRKKMQKSIAEQLSWLTMLILYWIARS